MIRSSGDFHGREPASISGFVFVAGVASSTRLARASKDMILTSGWLKRVSTPAFESMPVPTSGVAIGAVEARRGAGGDDGVSMWREE